MKTIVRTVAITMASAGVLALTACAVDPYYGAQQAPVDLTWKCKVDYRGFVSGVDIDRAQTNYGYGAYTPYSSPYANDYSQYGYRRY